ncbi:MAG: hypothetical protein ABR541_05890, partial [Candidatus Dormibacteria bacterium]
MSTSSGAAGAREPSPGDSGATAQPASPGPASPQVRPRRGVSGFLSLFSEAAGLLRERPALRHSFLGWTGFGLLFTIGASTGVAALHDRGGLVPVILGAVAWWLFVCLFVLGGAPLLIDPQGRHAGRYGIPNGLTALRAWFCLPLILDASLRLPGELALILWCSTGF